MPKIVTSTPQYRLHRASGQAVVTIAGRDVYLGPQGTSASRIEYDRVVGEWITAGRPNRWSATTDITVVDVAAAFMKHARDYYRKNVAWPVPNYRVIGDAVSDFLWPAHQVDRMIRPSDWEAGPIPY